MAKAQHEIAQRDLIVVIVGTYLRLYHFLIPLVVCHVGDTRRCMLRIWSSHAIKGVVFFVFIV